MKVTYFFPFEVLKILKVHTCDKLLLFSTALKAWQQKLSNRVFYSKVQFQVTKIKLFIYCSKKDSVMHFLIYISTPGIPSHYLAHKRNVLPCLLIFDYVVKDFQQNKLRNVNYKSQALQYLKIKFFSFWGT